MGAPFYTDYANGRVCRQCGNMVHVHVLCPDGDSDHDVEIPDNWAYCPVCGVKWKGPARENRHIRVPDWHRPLKMWCSVYCKDHQEKYTYMDKATKKLVTVQWNVPVWIDYRETKLEFNGLLWYESDYVSAATVLKFLRECKKRNIEFVVVPASKEPKYQRSY